MACYPVFSILTILSWTKGPKDPSGQGRGPRTQHQRAGPADHTAWALAPEENTGGVGGRGVVRRKGRHRRSCEYSNGLVPGLPRGAPRSPGPRSKLGCAGRPWGCSGPRPRGSPKMAPRCGAWAVARAPSPPVAIGANFATPAVTTVGSTAGTQYWGPGVPGGRVRNGLGDLPVMTPLQRPPQAPRAAPRPAAHPIRHPRPSRAHLAPPNPQPAVPLTPGPPAALT